MTINRALQLLNLESNFTPDDLKKAYRNAIKKVHPDLNYNQETSNELASLINEAYSLLKNSNRVNNSGFHTNNVNNNFRKRQQPYTNHRANIDFLVHKEKVIFTFLSHKARYEELIFNYSYRSSYIWILHDYVTYFYNVSKTMQTYINKIISRLESATSYVEIAKIESDFIDVNRETNKTTFDYLLNSLKILCYDTFNLEQNDVYSKSIEQSFNLSFEKYFNNPYICSYHIAALFIQNIHVIIANAISLYEIRVACKNYSLKHKKNIDISNDDAFINDMFFKLRNVKNNYIRKILINWNTRHYTK